MRFLLSVSLVISLGLVFAGCNDSDRNNVTTAPAPTTPYEKVHFVYPFTFPTGEVGENYSSLNGFAIPVDGTATPFTWTIEAGALPPGLSLGPAGIISGIPTLVGNYNFNVRVTDTQGGIAELITGIVVDDVR